MASVRKQQEFLNKTRPYKNGRNQKLFWLLSVICFEVAGVVMLITDVNAGEWLL